MMPTVVGVRFRSADNLYFYECTGMDLSLYDKVVVKVDGGMALASVVMEPYDVDVWTGPELKRVVRKAERRDLDAVSTLAEKEREAFKVCKEKIQELGLEMNLVKVEYILSGNKAFFFFTAEGRVDFRTLVRELARVLRIRIEMRQIGVRDEAKMVGGIGICGRELCCSRFLSKFSQVSIKMAKDQSMSLAPEKVSGQCGRLLCCLSYEQGFYKEMLSGLPKLGKRAQTPHGEARIVDINIFQNTITAESIGTSEREVKIYNIDRYRDFLDNKEIAPDDVLQSEEEALKVQPKVSAKEAAEILEKEIDKRRKEESDKKRKASSNSRSASKQQRQPRQSRQKKQQESQSSSNSKRGSGRRRSSGGRNSSRRRSDRGSSNRNDKGKK